MSSNNRQSTFDIYVGHVPKTIQQETLLEIFSKFGAVVDVLIRQASGAFGYAIVKFKNKKDADKVVKTIPKIYIGEYEMDVRYGKRGNQNNTENNNGYPTLAKTVSFVEPSTSFPFMGNGHFIEPPKAVRDHKFSEFAMVENMPYPVRMEILCTHVESAITFHGCPLNQIDEMMNLAANLNNICPGLVGLLRKPCLNKIYGALYKEDHQWYRCRILQVTASGNPSSCLVQYIDYGNISEVCYSDMVELPEPIKKLNPFAVQCVFSTLIPTSKSQITYLHHLVNNRMSLLVQSCYGIPQYQVSKCTCNGIDVIHELVMNGFAKYRNLGSPSASFSPPFSDEGLEFRTQENYKSKGNGRTTDKKKSALCNGTMDKHPCEIKQVMNHNQVHNCKSSSSIESHCDNFTPKKIIKRGSKMSQVKHQVFEETATANPILKIDSAISSLKLVNNIRSLIPLDTNDDLINQAIDLLKNEMNVTLSDDAKQLVEEAYKEYNTALAVIKKCSNQEDLPDLKEKRNKQRMELFSELKKFIENFDSTLFEKKKKVQEIITALESNSTAWLNVYLQKNPDTIEGLIAEFSEEKEKKKTNIELARKNTDEKHAVFMKVFTDLEKELALNKTDNKSDDSYLVTSEGKKGSWALKFDETLNELSFALEEETHTCTVIKDKNHSVIQCVLEKLDIPKEKIDAECELYEKYKSLYCDLEYTSDLSPVFNELLSLQTLIQGLKSCLNCEEVENQSGKLHELHSAILQEDSLLMVLAKAATQHFPELVQEHPELNLNEYQKYSYLLKLNWDVSFFPLLKQCSRIEPSYIAKLVDEPVVIKEFSMSKESESNAMKKVIRWNEIKSDFLVKIKGLFRNKAQDLLYMVVPTVWETLYENPLAVPVDYKTALDILHQALEGLCDVHSRGLVHGAVHPMSILHNNGKVMLDFNMDLQCLQDKKCLKGINFEIPNGEDLFKSADMYGFGCLVLWVLFPNLTFHSTAEGLPDVKPFKSIIQDMLTAKDFTSLCNLLNVNGNVRPSSRVLRSQGFLKKLSIMSEI